MDFSMFCKKLHPIIGNGCTHYSFVADLFSNIVEENFNIDDILGLSKSTLNKYFSGNSPINSIAKRIINNLDPGLFEMYINKNVSDETIDIITVAFSVSPDNYAYEITELFVNIIKNAALSSYNYKNLVDLNKMSEAPLEKIVENTSKLTQKMQNSLAIANNSLPKDIRTDFEFVETTNANGTDIAIVGKTEDAYFKHEVAVDFSYNMETKSEEEKDQIKKLYSIIH